MAVTRHPPEPSLSATGQPRIRKDGIPKMKQGALILDGPSVLYYHVRDSLPVRGALGAALAALPRRSHRRAALGAATFRAPRRAAPNELCYDLMCPDTYMIAL